MSNNNEEMERKRKFAELRKKAEEAERNKNPIRRDKPAVQTGVGSDRFKAASSTLAGVFGGAGAAKPSKPEATKVNPPTSQPISSRMKQMQAELEKARQLDAEKAKNEAAAAPAATATAAAGPAAPEAPQAPAAPGAPEAPSAPMAPAAPAAPTAPMAPVAPSAPNAPNVEAPSIADMIKARRQAKTPGVSGTATTHVENKGTRPVAGGGPAITEDAIRGAVLKKVNVEDKVKPATSATAGGVNFAAEAARKRAEMMQRKAEGGSAVAPKTSATAAVPPKLTEAQLKAQEREARSRAAAGKPITIQAQNTALKATQVVKKDEPPTPSRPRSGGVTKR